MRPRTYVVALAFGEAIKIAPKAAVRRATTIAMLLRGDETRWARMEELTPGARNPPAR